MQVSVWFSPTEEAPSQIGWNGIVMPWAVLSAEGLSLRWQLNTSNMLPHCVNLYWYSNVCPQLRLSVCLSCILHLASFICLSVCLCFHLNLRYLPVFSRLVWLVCKSGEMLIRIWIRIHIYIQIEVEYRKDSAFSPRSDSLQHSSGRKKKRKLPPLAPKN